MSFLLERDTLHGAAGKAVVIQNGRVKDLFGAKAVKTQAEISSTGMKVIGTKKEQQILQLRRISKFFYKITKKNQHIHIRFQIEVVLMM